MSQRDYETGFHGGNYQHTMDLMDFRKGQEAGQRQKEETARAWQRLLDQNQAVFSRPAGTGGTGGTASGGLDTPDWVLSASKACGLIVTALVGLAAYQTTTVQPLVVAVIAGSLAGIVTIVALRLLFHLVMGAFLLAKGVVVVLAVLFGVQLLTGAPWGSDAVSLLRELVQSLAE